MGKTANVPISETGTANDGNQRGTRVLQKNKHHENDQQHRLEQRGDDLPDPFLNRQRRIQRDQVFHVIGEICGHFLHHGFDLRCNFKTICTRQLVDRQDRCRTAVQTTGRIVGLCAKLDPRNILHPHLRPIRVGADNHVAEFFGIAKRPWVRTW